MSGKVASTPKKNTIPEIEYLEEVLSIQIPIQYAEFIEAQVLGKYLEVPILGLPITPAIDSVWGATQLVWNLRPTLKRKVIALQFREDSAVCLEIEANKAKNMNVVIVGFSTKSKPVVLANSFSEFLIAFQSSESSLEAKLNALNNPSPGKLVHILSDELNLEFPESLQKILTTSPPKVLDGLVYRITGNSFEPPHLLWALKALNESVQSPPKNLIPIMPVDSRSFACVVCSERHGAQDKQFGKVIRWHLDNIPKHAQGVLLDIDAISYLQSMKSELEAREVGLRKINEIADAYEDSHVKQHRLPKAHEIRPIRLAVQNVIVGLAAFFLDSSFDGLSVEVWQTCQVPHLNAHESCRALASMTLAEAFKCGSTMEIRFDKHPEKSVPASLRQYARIQGISLGGKDAKAIMPDESRALFWSVTQMPEQLAKRVEEVVNQGGLSSERACFVLMSNIWRPIELGYILAISDRAISILHGGVEPFERANFQAEILVCRSAHMLGMFLARLSQEKDIDNKKASALEDEKYKIRWEILPEYSAVKFENLPSREIPWIKVGNQTQLEPDQPLIVMPRTTVHKEDTEMAVELRKRDGGLVVGLIPQNTYGTKLEEGRKELPILVCPEKVAEFDRTIDMKLLNCRVGRM